MGKKKILLAIDSPRVIDHILGHSKAKNYDIKVVTDGPSCIHEIAHNPPDLMLLKIMLPKMHGIEILSKIRKDKQYDKMGVILCSYKLMIQDYHSAMEHGADYFLDIPFEADIFFELVDLFFQGKLEPAPFQSDKILNHNAKSDWYIPSFHRPENLIKFWGTRGSSTVAGNEYVRFGGNSCCLEVRMDKQLIIIDAGTGIRPLGDVVIQEDIKEIHIFLGHFHWDHIIGFPFFEPLYSPEYTIHVWAPEGFGRPVKDLFTELLAYEFFPIRLDELQAKLVFHAIQDQNPVTLGDITINFHYTFHPGVTFGFKIISPRRKIAYITDNEMLIGYHGHPNDISLEHPMMEGYLSMVEFFKGCDLFIHEAQYSPEEYKEKVGWGHSSISNAAVLAKYCEAPEWFITHHDPKHTDEKLFKKFQLHKDIMTDCQIPTHVHMAYDGLILSI